MQRVFTKLSVWLLAAILSFILFNPRTAAADSYSPAMDMDGLLTYSNAERAAAGENPLRTNDALAVAAQAKANDMVSENYWAHYSPGGVSPWSFIANAGYSYSAAGENLAYGFATSNDVITAWMNSAEHRANLLHAGFADVGFGVAASPDFVGTGPETIVVAEYGTPLYPPVPASGNNTPSVAASSQPAAAPTATALAASTTQTAPSPTASRAAGHTPTPTSTSPPKHSNSHVPAWLQKLRSGDLGNTLLKATAMGQIYTSVALAATAGLAVVGYTATPARLYRHWSN